MKLSNGAKVVKTKLIKTGQDLTANVGFEYKEVKLGLATKFSREVSITDSKEENHQEERFYPYRETVRIPEMSLVVYSHEWAEKVVVVPYSGTVQIDGPVKPNKHGIKLLSEVLPTPVDRTFEFSGAVEDAQVFSGISLNDSRKLSKEECKKVAPPKLYEPFVRQTGKYPDESKGVAQ